MSEPSTPEFKLRSVFAEVLALPSPSGVESLSFRSVPQWDSIAQMHLVSALEAAFGVVLEPEEVIDLSSFGAAKAILARHGVPL